MSQMLHFLLVFNHDKSELVHTETFADSDEAVAAYSAKERECESDTTIEIVLIGSDSIETVMLTHANYFDGSVALSKYFAGI